MIAGAACGFIALGIIFLRDGHKTAARMLFFSAGVHSVVEIAALVLRAVSL